MRSSIRKTGGGSCPSFQKKTGFKHHYLRSLLMNDWNYSKRYVDSAIKQAYSIIKSWRRNYLKGERSREKPAVKREVRKDKGNTIFV